jgi:RecA-family ATPase
MSAPTFDQSYLDSFTDLGEPISVQPREKKRRLALVNAASLADKQIPQREWLVDEIIPMRQVTLIYGDGATGKTLIELQLSVAVATGTDWLGKLPKEGNVLILSAEDDIDETHRRLADIVAGREFNMADLGGLTIAPLAGEDALLAVSGRGGVLSATDLLAEVEATVQDIQPIMLAIDTLADTFGGDEINRAQARQFIGMLRGLAVKFNMAVVVLAHPSLSGMASGAGTSGNTAWSNSVRSRLYLEPVKTDTGGVPDDALRRLTVKKVNYAKVGTEIMMRWERGRFVLAASDWKSSLTNIEIDALFLELLEQFTHEARNVTATRGTSYAPSEFANHADAKGVSKEAFKKAMDRLLGTAKIENVESGSPSRRRSRLVTASEGDD